MQLLISEKVSATSEDVNINVSVWLISIEFSIDGLSTCEY